MTWHFANGWRNIAKVPVFVLFNVYWFPEVKGIILFNFMLELISVPREKV